MNKMGKNIKTISSNLSMDMVDDVLQFHNKGNLILDSTFYHRIASHTLSLEQFESLELSDYEITPFYNNAIDCDGVEACQIKRNKSAKNFTNQKISFSKIKALCANAFQMDENESRPYPSGGAIYPIEVICVIFSEKILNAPASGFYHYRPTLNILQVIKEVDDISLQNLLYSMELSETQYPNFAFIYFAVIGKMLVKYRYRGYRYALMETGAMFHQADLVAQFLGINNKIYSGFNDHEILQFIGLDKMTFMPLAIQSFGVSNEISP